MIDHLGHSGHHEGRKCLISIGKDFGIRLKRLTPRPPQDLSTGVLLLDLFFHVTDVTDSLYF